MARAPVLTSPTAEPRPRKGEPTRDELDDVARVLEALHSAKGRAGMPVGPRAGKPGTGQGKAILKRLRELRDDGEADPVPLLCAVMHAKVERDAQSDEPERASGRWANGVTICRDAWWDANLAAGRRYLQGPRHQAPRPTLAYGAMAKRWDAL